MFLIFLSIIFPISCIEIEEDTIICNVSLSKVLCDKNICVCNDNNMYENVERLIITGIVKKEHYVDHIILINNCTLEVIFKNLYIECIHCSVSPFAANNSVINFKYEGGNNIYQFDSHDAAIECANDSTISFSYLKSFKDDYLYVEGNMKGAGIGTGEFSGHCKGLSFNDGNITSISYGEAAGIGTGNNHPTIKAIISKITINGGSISAIGPRGTYYYGSGIGVGMSGTVESIIINNGNVTAKGNYGAGIGGGFNGHIGTIQINNGTITSYSYGTSGIGGGYHYDIVDSIIINDGIINSTSYFGAAIGGGANSEVKKIIINNGSIFASVEGVGISYSSGIGSGQNGTCHNVQINGGNITSIGVYGAGIGASNSANCSLINITGGTINATGTRGAGIGAGAGYNMYKGGVDLISISGGVITAVGIDSSGIGGGYSRSMHSSCVGLIEISGDSTQIDAFGKNGAGIGSCFTEKRFGSHIDSINISGGKIKAQGTAGIGGSSRERPDTGNVDSITISGGEIEAIGLYNGIGAGTATKLDSLSISGGNIKARSTVNGAAIGGGGLAKIGLISITGGVIDAEAEGQGGAGIGVGTSISGQQKNESQATIDTILIGKANVHAKGKNYGAGIGGGETVGFNSSFISHIIINKGAQITAEGGDYAAGIGGGYQSFVGEISLLLEEEDEETNVIGFAGQFAADGIGDGFFGKTEKIDTSKGKLVCSENNNVCVFSKNENPDIPPAQTRILTQSEVVLTQSASPTQSQYEPTQSQSPSQSKEPSQTDHEPTSWPSQSQTIPQKDESDSTKILTPAIIAAIAIGSTIIVGALIVGGIFLVKKYKSEKYAKHKDPLIGEDDHPP